MPSILAYLFPSVTFLKRIWKSQNDGRRVTFAFTGTHVNIGTDIVYTVKYKPLCEALI
jgi:hypothetical protein